MFIRRPSFNPDLYGSRTTFSPTDLGAALVAWWNADDHGTANMTDDGGGLISAWADRISGVSVAAVTTARPTWTANAFNSAYAGLTFDGTANCMTTTSFAALPTSTTPGEIWAVASAAGSGDTSVRLIIREGSTSAGAYRRLGKTTAARAPTCGDGTTSATVSGSAYLWDGPAIVGGRFDATAYTIRVNGRDYVTTTGATLNTGGGTLRMRIGADNATSPATFWLGVISDVMVTTALTDVQRQQLEGWFAWNRGLVGS